MNKQEAIKKAWGDQYPTDGADDNGWSKKEFKYGDYNVSDFDAKMYLCGANIRPKELRGIENNNGWIKITTKEDLPKTQGEFWVICIFFNKSEIEKRDYPNFKFSEEVNQDWWLKFVTHYQPIIKPALPIY